MTITVLPNPVAPAPARYAFGSVHHRAIMLRIRRVCFAYALGTRGVVLRAMRDPVMLAVADAQRGMGKLIVRKLCGER